MKTDKKKSGYIGKSLFLCLLIWFCNSSSVYAQNKIGIALPMMSSSDNSGDKKLGEQMLMGIKDALEEYNGSHTTKKVSITVEDTKKDPGETLQIFNKFGSDKDVVAILGPVFSSELVNNEGAAAFHKIPIISPTATENNLASKNPFVFQLNPTYEIRGGLMADFADKELNMKKFVIFSEDTYGVSFTEAFTNEVIKNGGEVIFTKYYSKENFDLTNDLEELKNVIITKDRFIDFGTLSEQETNKLRGIDFKFSYTDSLVRKKLVVSIYKLFGRNAVRISDSIGISPVRISTMSDSKDYIPGYIEAVYIPISNSDEITKIVPQIFSNKINIPFLGTSDWNNESVLRENNIYIKELYFESDFYLKDKDKSDQESLDEAQVKNYYFGYDAMKLILSLISKGNNTRQSINDALEKVTDYKAEHCNFTIKDRTNHQMNIMKYENGKLEKLVDSIY